MRRVSCNFSENEMLIALPARPCPTSWAVGVYWCFDWWLAGLLASTAGVCVWRWHGNARLLRQVLALTQSGVSVADSYVSAASGSSVWRWLRAINESTGLSVCLCDWQNVWWNEQPATRLVCMYYNRLLVCQSVGLFSLALTFCITYRACGVWTLCLASQLSTCLTALSILRSQQ